MSTIDGGGREWVAEGTVMMGPSREGFGLGVDKRPQLWRDSQADATTVGERQMKVATLGMVQAWVGQKLVNITFYEFFWCLVYY
jgi:hypothetical protein